ncbi:MAG: penicillin acylase family protein, partial [Deltaproteobacteria bacterium]|nr:penicillin acylase family protein [Deltaproteobacteria bacterium]
GWDEAFEWKGYIPFAKLPRLYNPPEGAIATANNRVAGAAYPYYLSALFEPSYRIRRIRDLLGAKEKISPEDMTRIQKDTVSLHGKETVNILRAELEKITEPSLREMAEKLCQWNGDCREESLEAALFHVFYQRLARNLLADELGEQLYAAYTELFNQALTPIEGILKDSRAAWFASRSRSELVEQSLRESQAVLKRRLGTDSRKWHWGRLHTLTLHHAFDRIRILASLFSLGPFPSPGDAVTVNMGFYRHSNPFRHVVGPSMRMIADVGDWQNGRFILASGQSGHCFSPHYGDQTELWRRGAYIQLCYDEESMNDWPSLTLIPAPGETQKNP